MTTHHIAQQPRRSTARPLQILLVEDSPSDVAMTATAMREGPVAHELHVVDDGEKAMAFLRRQGEYANAPRPDLVLLDLNLPRMDGREVLAEVKSDPLLELIPVVVLTTSKAEADILRSYRLHANAYITKPVDLENFFSAIHGIENFWLSLVQLPDGLTGG